MKLTLQEMLFRAITENVDVEVDKFDSCEAYVGGIEKATLACLSILQDEVKKAKEEGIRIGYQLVLERYNSLTYNGQFEPDGLDSHEIEAGYTLLGLKKEFEQLLRDNGNRQNDGGSISQ